jgi:hypothetical protein
MRGVFSPIPDIGLPVLSTRLGSGKRKPRVRLDLAAGFSHSDSLFSDIEYDRQITCWP